MAFLNSSVLWFSCQRPHWTILCPGTGWALHSIWQLREIELAMMLEQMIHLSRLVRSLFRFLGLRVVCIISGSEWTLLLKSRTSPLTYSLWVCVCVQCSAESPKPIQIWSACETGCYQFILLISLKNPENASIHLISNPSRQRLFRLNNFVSMC